MCDVLKLLQEYNADFHQVNGANVTALGELNRIREMFRHASSIELLSQLEEILTGAGSAELKMCVIIEGEQVQDFSALLVAPHIHAITILLADEFCAVRVFLCFFSRRCIGGWTRTSKPH